MAPWPCTRPCGRSSARPPLIQRCQVHKLRNILDHLPERQRPWVQAIVRRASQARDVKTADARLLTDLATRLEDDYPSAAGSVREGLDRNADRPHVAPLDPPAAVARHD